MAITFTTIDAVGSLTTPKSMMSAIDGNFTGAKAAIDLNTLKLTNANHTGEVTGSGALTITAKAVTYAKIQDITATDKILGRKTAGAGVTEEITCTAAGRALIDDASAADQITTLGALAKSDFTAADEIIVGTGVGTHNQVTLAASEFLAKKASGVATNVSAAEVMAILNAAATAGFSFNSQDVDAGTITTDPTALPGFEFKDSDGDDPDINGKIYGNLTDTGSGTEDFDIHIQQQVAGTITDTIFSDADGNLELGTAAQPVEVKGGQVIFPSTAIPSADVNTLDDYTEYVAASTACTGAITTEVIWKATKIGNVVTVVLPLTAQGAGVAVNAITFGVALPAAFRPAAITAILGPILIDNAATLTAPGVCYITTAGVMELYIDSSLGTAFTVTANAGLAYDFSFSFVV